MSVVRGVAMGAGLCVGIVALGFGLFGDTSLLTARLRTSDAVRAPAPTAPTLEQVAAGNRPPPGAKIDREIAFKPPSVSADAPPIAQTPGASPDPAVGPAPPTVTSWGNPAKPGEPMLDPTPRQ